MEAFIAFEAGSISHRGNGTLATFLRPPEIFHVHADDPGQPGPIGHTNGQRRRPCWSLCRHPALRGLPRNRVANRSEEHTSELQSRPHLVCRLLLEKKKKKQLKTN